MTSNHGVWVLGEERNLVVHRVTFELLAWGRHVADALDEPVTCVILGKATHEVGERLVLHGADRVIAVQHPQLAGFRTDSYVRILCRILEGGAPSVLLAAASTLGRTVMPILAIKLVTGLTADCTGLDVDPEDGALLQTRPAIGGNVLATIKTPNHRPQMATVRPKSCMPLVPDPTRTGDIVCDVPDPLELGSRVRRIAYEPDPIGERVIEDADIIVSGGKGMGRAGAFDIVRDLAVALGGVSGASRVAVDLGWAPHTQQIGLSGKSVRPKLYMALGISGSPNHLAGMSTSDRIVAVNRDPDADIFRVADFGIVGDVHEVVPALLQQLAVTKKETG